MKQPCDFCQREIEIPFNRKWKRFCSKQCGQKFYYAERKKAVQAYRAGKES